MKKISPIGQLENRTLLQCSFPSPVVDYVAGNGCPSLNTSETLCAFTQDIYNPDNADIFTPCLGALNTALGNWSTTANFTSLVEDSVIASLNQQETLAVNLNATLNGFLADFDSVAEDNAFIEELAATISQLGATGQLLSGTFNTTLPSGNSTAQATLDSLTAQSIQSLKLLADLPNIQKALTFLASFKWAK